MRDRGIKQLASLILKIINSEGTRKFVLHAELE
jgi:hypothetical protein